MRYFGKAWNQTVAASEQVPTPIGAPCGWCDEPIADGERGFLMPRPMHLECLIRQGAGSVAHQQKTCRCHGGTGQDDDPPGLTRRQAAIEAANYFRGATMTPEQVAELAAHDQRAAKMWDDIRTAYRMDQVAFRMLAEKAKNILERMASKSQQDGRVAVAVAATMGIMGLWQLHERLAEWDAEAVEQKGGPET